MTHTFVFWMFATAAVFPLITMPLIMRAVRRQERIDLRMWEVQRSTGEGSAIAKPVTGGAVVLEVIERLGRAMTRSGILSQATLTELQETLAETRLRGTRGLSIFVGMKVMLFLGMPLVMLAVGRQFDISSGPLLSLTALAGIFGLLAPDTVLKRIRKGYLKQVEAGLADALDLMVICAEAGLGLEPAIERVSQEIAVAHKAVAQELTRTSQDLRMVADRKTALMNMGSRTGLECLQRLALTLVQSSQLGTPLTRALRTISAELRNDALVKFEARAARLPVILTVPMILFILPCVFIVVAGPVALTAMRTFHAHHN